MNQPTVDTQNRQALVAATRRAHNKKKRSLKARRLWKTHPHKHTHQKKQRQKPTVNLQAKRCFKVHIQRQRRHAKTARLCHTKAVS